MFFPNERFTLLAEPAADGLTLESTLENCLCTSALYEDGVRLLEDRRVLSSGGTEDMGGAVKEIKRLLKLSMYHVLRQKTGIVPPWGILTGIRPAKIASELLERGSSRNAVIEHVTGCYLVSADKARLMTGVAENSRRVLKNRRAGAYGLYIGVPFCPTKCRYCSFTSYPISKYQSKTEDYINSIASELKHVSSVINAVPESIYIGGGTPVALTESGLWKLLELISACIDVKACGEFTVEAGRPDAINAEKLRILRDFGVTRLSINPQTMNDSTLQRIGRAHTTADFLDKFQLARSMGFDNINTDLILGLPGETAADVRDTFEWMERIKPDCVTVHTLAIKRASAFNEELRENRLLLGEAPQLMEEMLQISVDYMWRMGMEPYYMYRQKNSLGNFENVSYCRPGCECLYNMRIMEENQLIVALGAGGVSKTVDVATGKIERVFNPKSVDDYIQRIDEMIERKKAGGL